MANKNPNQEYKDESYFKPESCPSCHNKEIIRWGFRYNHTTKKRRYMCKSCKRLFVVDDGFSKCKKKREMITACLDLYMNGMSLRKVANHVNQFSDTKLSHMAVMKWLRKYSKTIEPFTRTLPLDLSGDYHADEIFVKCKGKENYFWDMVDAETRFLVATHYSLRRDIDSAKILLNNAKLRADKPVSITTDGLHAYIKSMKKVWYNKHDSRETKVMHLRITSPHDYSNNIIERIQGTIRERVKVMRGFHSPQSAELILNLFVIWYNFLRVHQGIGMTPAEMAGIELNLDKDRWLNLIYRSKIN